MCEKFFVESRKYVCGPYLTRPSGGLWYCGTTVRTAHIRCGAADGSDQQSKLGNDPNRRVSIPIPSMPTNEGRF